MGGPLGALNTSLLVGGSCCAGKYFIPGPPFLPVGGGWASATYSLWPQHIDRAIRPAVVEEN